MEKAQCFNRNGPISLKDIKYVCYYFGAEWDKQCKSYTPILSKFYELTNQTKKQLEIIYVSLDPKEEEFMNYFKTMAWGAHPYT